MDDLGLPAVDFSTSVFIYDNISTWCDSMLATASINELRFNLECLKKNTQKLVTFSKINVRCSDNRFVIEDTYFRTRRVLDVIFRIIQTLRRFKHILASSSYKDPEDMFQLFSQIFNVFDIPIHW